MTSAERVMRGVSLLFAWFSLCCTLKIANFFFGATAPVALSGLSLRYIPIKSLYPTHNDRLYPCRQRMGSVLQLIHTIGQVMPLDSDTLGQVSLYLPNCIPA